MERLARLSRENLNACIEIGIIRYFHKEPKFRIENFFAVVHIIRPSPLTAFAKSFIISTTRWVHKLPSVRCENPTRGRWVRSANATSELCAPLQYRKLKYLV